jgi:hypothetical protein
MHGAGLTNAIQDSAYSSTWRARSRTSGSGDVELALPKYSDTLFVDSNKTQPKRAIVSQGLAVLPCHLNSTIHTSTMIVGSMERTRLPEFIEILVPTRDKNGKAVAASIQREWRKRLTRYLLESLKVTGFQESKRSGVWKRERKKLWEVRP